MGNFFSYDHSDNIICAICNSFINQPLYLDIECSNCNEYCRMHYHNNCFENYMQTKVHIVNLCNNCTYIRHTRF